MSAATFANDPTAILPSSIPAMVVLVFRYQIFLLPFPRIPNLLPVEKGLCANLHRKPNEHPSFPMEKEYIAKIIFSFYEIAI